MAFPNCESKSRGFSIRCARSTNSLRAWGGLASVAGSQTWFDTRWRALLRFLRSLAFQAGAGTRRFLASLEIKSGIAGHFFPAFSAFAFSACQSFKVRNCFALTVQTPGKLA